MWSWTRPCPPASPAAFGNSVIILPDKMPKNKGLQVVRPGQKSLHSGQWTTESTRRKIYIGALRMGRRPGGRKDDLARANRSQSPVVERPNITSFPQTGGGRVMPLCKDFGLGLTTWSPLFFAFYPVNIMTEFPKAAGRRWRTWLGPGPTLPRNAYRLCAN